MFTIALKISKGRGHEFHHSWLKHCLYLQISADCCQECHCVFFFKHLSTWKRLFCINWICFALVHLIIFFFLVAHRDGFTLEAHDRRAQLYSTRSFTVYFVSFKHQSTSFFFVCFLHSQIMSVATAPRQKCLLEQNNLAEMEWLILCSAASKICSDSLGRYTICASLLLDD